MYLTFSDRKKKLPEGSDENAPQTNGKLPDGTVRKTAMRVSSVVVSLGIVSMFTDISSESVAAVLPLYITSVLGLSTVAYGFIDGLYQGVSAIVRIAGGWAADRGDQPKWIAFFGYGISAVARIGLLFTGGFGAITSIVAIDRIGKGIRTAPRDAMITASSTPQNLGRSFGVHRMLDTVGAAVGPLLAFFVLFFIPNGYKTIFVISLACAIVGVIVLGLIVPNKHPRAEEAAKTSKPREPFRWRYINNPRLRRVLLASAMLGLLTVGDGFIYLVLQSRSSFAAEWFPLLYVGTNVAFLILAIPFGRLADRFGRARVFVVGHILLLATYVCAAIPLSGALITIVCLVLLGAFYAATDGVLAALAAESTPEASRASGIASAQTVVAVARLIASTGFGVLWFAVGRMNAMLIVSVLLALIIPVVALVLKGLFTKQDDQRVDRITE
jgi:MFS family permease